MLVEKIYHWIRRKFCKHRFRKHYDVADRKYICRCVRCGETRQYDHCENNRSQYLDVRSRLQKKPGRNRPGMCSSVSADLQPDQFIARSDRRPHPDTGKQRKSDY